MRTLQQLAAQVAARPPRRLMTFKEFLASGYDPKKPKLPGAVTEASEPSIHPDKPGPDRMYGGRLLD